MTDLEELFYSVEDPYEIAKELDYGLYPDESKELYDIYQEAKKNGNEEVVKKIEDVLTEINYHTEKKYLMRGDFENYEKAFRAAEKELKNELIKKASKVNAKLLIEADFTDDEDIENIYYQLGSEYPELDDLKETEYKEEDNHIKIVFEGTIDEKGIEDFLRLSHHAEGLYEGTRLENFHCEATILD